MIYFSLVLAKKCFTVIRSLSPLTTDPSGQLDIFGHDGDPLGMDGAEVGVLKETHKVSLASLLKSHYSRALEAQVSLEILSDLADQPLERELADQQLCRLLVPDGEAVQHQIIINHLPPDLPESNCSRPVSVRLLDTPSCRRRLACCLGCQLLSKVHEEK